MENALAIANFFIKKSFDTGEPVTNMKLVKLVYIAHGWYLGLSGQPLLSEPVEAWKYGPVVPSVYYSFKDFGGDAIRQMATGSNAHDSAPIPLPNTELVPFLEKIWEVYGQFSGIDLSAMTHQDNTPWKMIWDTQGQHSNNVIIPNDLIKEYYQKLVDTPHATHTA
ncbi:Panacea domain-containing protein [Rufibacter sp. XAAS-G3-1]|uniref:Panacea domain-containing protein n=1 Tax=Rufibacter sp. XAAS-G3-1 TaxID=2729134 RepID=UPI0015E77153|nr:type II toxin-antitoxin system antitoxin SocA domain-containing protein [Rufibacter sp. XAAS-G3-1]